MTSAKSIENQKISLELARSGVDYLKSSVYKVVTASNIPKKRVESLDSWIAPNDKNINKEKDFRCVECYEMPRKLDWNAFRKSYDIQPQNYEQLISVPGIGPASIRALSLIGEIIFGTKASWQDPVKYNFAHGGKDGVPYPVARRTYDKSISYLSSAIEGAEIEREQRILALRKLAEFSAKMFDTNRS
jgi:hypothetical protein